jgi:hypothetical protein
MVIRGDGFLQWGQTILVTYSPKGLTENTYYITESKYNLQTNLCTIHCVDSLVFDLLSDTKTTSIENTQGSTFIDNDFMKKDGSRAMTGALDLGDNALNNVTTIDHVETTDDELLIKIDATHWFGIRYSGGVAAIFLRETGNPDLDLIDFTGYDARMKDDVVITSADGAIKFRNNADDGDLDAMHTDSSDQLIIGDDCTALKLYVGGYLIGTFSGTGLALATGQKFSSDYVASANSDIPNKLFVDTAIGTCEPTLTKSNLTASSPILVSNTPQIIGSSTADISIPAAATAQDGYLTQADWNTFNNKEPAVTKSNLTASGVLSITNTPQIIGASVANIAITQCTSVQSGYLTKEDWLIFNGKENALTLDAPIYRGSGATINHLMLKNDAGTAITEIDTAASVENIATKVPSSSQVYAALSGKSDTTHNHNLADLTEHSYSSLTDKPTIPTLETSPTNGETGKAPNSDWAYKIESEACTLSGVKTFGSFPVTPSSAPTADYEVANKKYVLDEIVAAGGITTASDLPIVDAGGYFAATEVEGALQECFPRIFPTMTNYKDRTGILSSTPGDWTGTMTTFTTNALTDGHADVLECATATNGHSKYIAASTPKFVSCYIKLSQTTKLIRFPETLKVSGGVADLGYVRFNTDGTIAFIGVAGSDSSSTYIADTWYQIVIEWVNNTSCRFWLNGALIYSEVHTTAADIERLRMYSQDTNAGTWFIDRIYMGNDPAIAFGTARANYLERVIADDIMYDSDDYKSLKAKLVELEARIAALE